MQKVFSILILLVEFIAFFVFLFEFVYYELRFELNSLINLLIGYYNVLNHLQIKSVLQKQKVIKERYQIYY